MSLPLETTKFKNDYGLYHKIIQLVQNHPAAQAVIRQVYLDNPVVYKDPNDPFYYRSMMNNNDPYRHSGMPNKLEDIIDALHNADIIEVGDDIIEVYPEFTGGAIMNLPLESPKFENKFKNYHKIIQLVQNHPRAREVIAEVYQSTHDPNEPNNYHLMIENNDPGIQNQLEDIITALNYENIIDMRPDNIIEVNPEYIGGAIIPISRAGIFFFYFYF